MAKLSWRGYSLYGARQGVSAPCTPEGVLSCTPLRRVDSPNASVSYFCACPDVGTEKTHDVEKTHKKTQQKTHLKMQGEKLTQHSNSILSFIHYF